MAQSGPSDPREPLMDPEAQTSTEKKTEKEVEKSDWQKFTENPFTFMKEWFCINPLANLPALIILFGGIVCLVGSFMTLSSYIVGIIGFLVLGLSGQQIWALRALSEEIDTFEQENNKLEFTQARLEGEVASLAVKKEQLGNQVGRLEGTVTELKQFSEKLTDELSGFEALKENLEKFAAETGADIRKVLGEAQDLEKKMKSMTTQNERALLSKIAQDIEFMDQGAGMSKEEFESFFSRIPKNLQFRFNDLGMTFEKVAGADGVIDFTEIEEMIAKLMEENKEKLASLA